MAAGELEKTREDSAVEIRDVTEGSTFPWSKLPRDLQHKVLSYLSLQQLFQLRGVCQDWRSIVHRHDFAAMFDAMHSSEPPSPAICYVESSHPRRIEWAMYDYARSVWKKMSGLSCDANPRMGPNDSVYSEDYSVYPVGGLLCFHYKKLDVGTWLVWNPLTNKWKKLPPCKNAASKGATAFVYAFEADEAPLKSYKILMAHYRITQINRYQRRKLGDGSLVTEIYDSSTGSWTEPAPEHILQLRMIPFLSTRGGVLCNGVIYFRSSRNAADFTVERVLLCYDIKSGEWHEEVSDRRCTRIFEWDGRVMTVMLEPLHSEEDVVASADGRNYPASRFSIFKWDPASKRWVDTGLEIPMKIKRKFDYSVSMSTALLEMVAAGDYLVITGYARDGSFRTAVYNKAEKNWRCLSTAGSLRFSRSATCRLNGMVQFKPTLDWVP